MSKYAEHHDMLSSQQEGFRKERNTVTQHQNLMNVLSDAKISNFDIYMLYVDFSSAFNTIDHDTLRYSTSSGRHVAACHVLLVAVM